MRLKVVGSWFWQGLCPVYVVEGTEALPVIRGMAVGQSGQSCQGDRGLFSLEIMEDWKW